MMLDRIFFFLIVCVNLIAGILHGLWLGGAVTPSLIIWGGASAIFFMLIAKTFEERVLSLLCFIVNNLIIGTLLIKPDPCIFIVALSLILLAAFHLFLWLHKSFWLDLIFFGGLLSRIFFDPMMGCFGFGLVTELCFLRLYSLFFSFLNKKKYISGEGSIIEPLLYLIPACSIALLNLHKGMEHVVMQTNFVFAGASLVYLIVLSERINEVLISYCLYIVANFAIGYLLSKSIMTFCQVTLVFILSNLFFASFFLLKARRSTKPLSHILLANNREGIKILLVVYFIVLGGLLAQLSAGSLYSDWLQGLGIQIGFLTILIYFLSDD